MSNQRTPGLSEDGVFGLVVSSLATGDLKRIGFSVDTALDFLVDVFKKAAHSDDPEQSFRGLFMRSQDALMASRKDDFLRIQNETPFSDFAQAELTRFFSIWKTAGVDKLRKNYIDRLEQNLSAANPQEPILVLSGDGTSFDPVKFSTIDVVKRVRAENWFINYEYGIRDTDWSETMHRTTFQSEIGKAVSVWDIELKDGTQTNVYFYTNR